MRPRSRPFLTGWCLLAPLALASCHAEGGPAPGEAREAPSASPAALAPEAQGGPEDPLDQGRMESELERGGTESAPDPQAAESASAAVAGFPLDGELEGDAKALLEEGLSLQRQGRYRGAIEVLARAAATAAPRTLRAEVLLELAETHFRQGQDAAEEDLIEGESADADESLRTALALFEAVAARYPEQEAFASLATYMCGSSYLLLGDTRSALARYKAAFENYRRSEDRPRALLRCGISYAALGDPVQARAFYQKYIRDYGSDSKLQSVVEKVRTRYLPELALTGRPAPKLRVSEWLRGIAPPNIDGLRGDVVVLVFFSSGCSHCEAELPRLRRDIARWTPSGVVFIGVADPTDRRATIPVEEFVRKHRVEFFDVALDEGGHSWGPYRVAGLPAAAVIDRNGTVRWRGHYTFLSQELLGTLVAE